MLWAGRDVGFYSACVREQQYFRTKVTPILAVFPQVRAKVQLPSGYFEPPISDNAGRDCQCVFTLEAPAVSLATWWASS